MKKISFGSSLSVTLDGRSLGFSVTKGRSVFTTAEEEPFVLFKSGRKILLCEAGKIDACRYDTGVGEGALVSLSDLPDTSLALSLYLWVEESSANLHLELITIREAEEPVELIAWPQPLYSFDEKGYTVMNLQNGKLFPDMMEEELHPTDDEGYFFRREGYMPFWGQVGKDGAGYLAVVETPWDAVSRFEHLPKSPTSVSVGWIPSLGKMDYRRSLLFRFYEKEADFVRFCKDYRAIARGQGRVTTLAEKLARNPNLEKMIGSAVIHTPSIRRHVTPESDYYNKEDLSKNDTVISFREMAERLERLHSLGVRDAYVHIDGWGRLGYDNLHPDVFPPSPEAGGAEGMRELLERTRRIGFLPAIHDNYRDYYLAAETFNENQAQVYADGSFEGDSIWYGGPQRKLCAALAPHYLKRNFDRMEREGYLPDGAYLDVFSVGPVDECANPMHRMTRRECIMKRRECFEYVRSREMIVSSEEPLDEMVDSLDLVHHSPWSWNTRAGINVPLMELVYHDAVLIPSFLGKGASSGKEDEYGILHALLQGNLPYLSIDASEEEIERISVVRALHAEVWNSELIHHGFIDSDPKRRISRFACGVTVEADLRENSYRITHRDGTVTSGKIEPF